MAAINFPTATADGQTFEADTGVIYTYNGTPPNGFWSGTFGTSGLDTLDAKYILQDDGGSVQTIKRSGLKINDNSNDTILLNSDGSASFSSDVGIGTTSPNVYSSYNTLTLNGSSGGEVEFETNDVLVGQVFSASSGFYFRSLSSTPIILQQDSSQRLVIDSSGNVGIGTSAPERPLTVSANNPMVQLDATGGNGRQYSLASVDDTSGAALGTSGNFVIYDDSSGGGSRLIIDSSGNVGINTTSPSEKLEVNSGTGNTPLKLVSTDGSVYISLEDSATSAANRVGAVGNNLVLHTNNTEQLRIDSSGNVGIGTTSPASPGTYSKVLNIADSNSSSIALSRTDSGTAHSLEMGAFNGASLIESTGATSLRFKVNSSEAARIDSSGNVGIGTTSPGHKLHLKGTDSSDAGDVTLRVDAGTASSNSATNNAVLDLTARGKNSGGTALTQNCEIRSVGQADPGGVLSFHTDDTSAALQERMRIDSSGNVGIGTTNPGYKLEVTEASANSLVRFDGANSAQLVFRNATSNVFEINAGGADDALSFGTAGNNERLRIDSSGRLLLGTTTEGAVNADTLTVAESGDSGITIRSGSANAGSLFFSDSTSGTAEYAGYLQYDHSADYLGIGTASTERLRIDSSGNVGIGTTSPLVPLHVSQSGDCRIMLQTTSAADNYEIWEIIAGANLSNHADLIFKTRANNGAGGDEAMRILRDGKIGIGTTSPGARLTVQDGSNAEGAILVGANYDGSGLTNSQTKLAPIHMPHYTNAEESIRLIAGYSDASQSIVSIGGGTNAANVATKVQIFTAADTTTTGGTAAITVDSSQRVGIGTTSPAYKLHVNGVSRFDDHIEFGGSISTPATAAAIYRPADNQLAFSTANTERLRIDSSGRLLIGTNGSNDIFQESQLQIEGNTSAKASLSIHQNQTAVDGPQLILGKSRGSGSVGASDILGDIVFAGNDGTDVNSRGAIIRAKIDGTPGSNDLPTHLAFMTTADGASSPTERMRIDSSGNVGIGGSPTAPLHIKRTSGAAAIHLQSQDGVQASVVFGDTTDESRGRILYSNNNECLQFEVNDMQEAMRIDSSGRLLVGVTTNYANAACDNLVVGNASASGNQGITIGSLNGSQISFADAGNARAGIIHYEHSDDSMRFYTDGSTNERMRILADGGLTFNGDTAQANALDDYEEGTWTPNLGADNSALTGITYDIQSGYYRKVGRIVYIAAYITWTARSNTSSAAATISLPFQSHTGTHYRGSMHVATNNCTYHAYGFDSSSTRNLGAFAGTHLSHSSSYMQLSFAGKNNGSWSSDGLRVNGLGASGGGVQISGTYMT